MKPVPCGSCGALVEWTFTEKGNRMPVDAEPTEAGNITIRMHRGPGEPGTAHYLSRDEKAELQRQAVYRGDVARFFVSHFATCPDADFHRKRKPAATAEKG